MLSRFSSALHFAARGGSGASGSTRGTTRWGFELDLFVLVFDLDVEQGVGFEATVGLALARDLLDQ